MTMDYVPPEGGEGKHSSNSLTLVEFHDALLVAIRGETPATTLVAMKPVAEGMGLDWGGQYKKIAAHPVLATCVSLTEMQMPGDQRREWVFLPLNRLHFWLATVQTNRIADADIRARVIEYQMECADVLFSHFFGKGESIGGERETYAIPGPKPYHERSIAERTCIREDIRVAKELGGLPWAHEVGKRLGFPVPPTPPKEDAQQRDLFGGGEG